MQVLSHRQLHRDRVKFRSIFCFVPTQDANSLPFFCPFEASEIDFWLATNVSFDSESLSIAIMHHTSMDHSSVDFIDDATLCSTRRVCADEGYGSNSRDTLNGCDGAGAVCKRRGRDATRLPRRSVKLALQNHADMSRDCSHEAGAAFELSLVHQNCADDPLGSQVSSILSSHHGSRQAASAGGAATAAEAFAFKVRACRAWVSGGIT